jgi:hypothetical protein
MESDLIDSGGAQRVEQLGSRLEFRSTQRRTQPAVGGRCRIPGGSCQSLVVSSHVSSITETGPARPSLWLPDDMRDRL